MQEVKGTTIARLPGQTKRISAILTIAFFFTLVATILVSSWIITFLFTKNLTPSSFTPQSAPPMAIIKNEATTTFSASSQSLILSAEGSFDPDGGPLIYEWTITSGPQNIPIILPLIVSSDALYTVDKSLFSTPGVWVVTLTVTDNENEAASTSTYITVE
ncbi:MAG: hypothetical protein A2666_00985 [Parcubacteria group bacterium RIFCSPHIGHO2_01_FULL_47_10b]|nr:MAG: hypothetical protein A2666_00985 [Parcubacteria group bacterium RIFCSPHIGHO2_01_FULL_47_10b]